MLLRGARHSSQSNSHLSLKRLQRPWLRTTYNGASGIRRSVNARSKPGLTSLGPRMGAGDGRDGVKHRTMASHRPMDTIFFEDMNPAGTHLPPPSFNPILNIETNLVSRGIDALTAGTTRLRRHGNLGVGGNFSEIVSVYDACLQVGRLERAGRILERLRDTPGMKSLVESLGLHLRYVRASLEGILQNPTVRNRNALHTWFELQVRKTGVIQSTEMVAYLVKAALQGPEPQRQRLVRRYMDMLDEDSALQILAADILTPMEINSVAILYPKYNFSTQIDEIMERNEDIETLAAEDGHKRHAPAVEVGSPDIEVSPTIQKGLGLRTLKQALSLFDLPGQGIKLADMDEQMKRTVQIRIEQDCVDAAIQRWREENAQLAKMGLGSALQTKSVASRMWKWQVALEEYLKGELQKVEEAEAAEKKTHEEYELCMHGPLLRVLPVSKIAALTILTTMNKFSDGRSVSVPLASLVMEIARNVEDENSLDVARKMADSDMWPKKLKARLSPDHLRRLRRRGGGGSITKLIRSIATSEIGSPLHVPQQWPLAQAANVGALLVSALVEVAKVPCTLIHAETKEEVVQSQPAFSHDILLKHGKRVGVISLNEALVDMLKREPVHALLAKNLPMIVAPDRWTGYSKGGFLINDTKVIRSKSGDKDQMYYAEAAIGQGNMDKTFKGLDVLGQTPWRINKSVFNVMLEAWNTGEALANLAPENPTVVIPPEPAPGIDPRERSKWIREIKAIENQRTGFHSQRCFQNFQLEIARALKNEVFYFPHNIDFRGRAYPIPPYLNHMGADHCRGLLVFGVGKQLGKGGLRWLKIHLANVFGFDKASLSEREEFATKNMDNVFNSALNPLNGNRWWLQAEDPWQCLATCFELKNALESGNPDTYVSHLPVHQDGTCNGLQHYAALGGDLMGAKQVNLEPGDRPADVYTAVAELVKEAIAKDKSNGVEMADYVDGKITRKTVKQTVMTNVYGVTFMGAKAQIKKQLDAANFDLPPKFGLDHVATYIADKVFAALGNMFRGAHDIQSWLGECAIRISTCLTSEQLSRIEAILSENPINEPSTKTSNPLNAPKSSRHVTKLEELTVFKTSVIWTNPLNMPVVQPYRSSQSRKVITQMQTVTLTEPNFMDPVSRRKQLQGFPPNFIHSLDASHMILSATTCAEQGMTFAAVHDSFWTHAKDVDTMNDVLRDSFVRIHGEDIITRLGAEFAARYKDSIFLAKVKKGTRANEEIAAWRQALAVQDRKRTTKAASSSTTHLKGIYRMKELMLEYKRQKLLSSSIPKEVQEGKIMVTPASLWEKYSDGSDIIFEETVETMDRTEKPIVSSEESEEALEDTIDLDSELESVDVAPKRGYFYEDFPENNISHFEKTMSEPAEKKAKTVVRHNYLWLPLVFPKVPQRGNFDVSRLKDSKYFFS